MKTIIEKIICILVILIVLFSINTKVYAWSQVFSDATNFIHTGENSNQADVASSKLEDLSGFLYNMLLSAGVVIAVIIATVLGIQFMTSSAEGQAKVKEALIPFVVGCIVVFGGFGIWKIGITIGQKIEDEEYAEKSCGTYVGYSEEDNGGLYCKGTFQNHRCYTLVGKLDSNGVVTWYTDRIETCKDCGLPKCKNCGGHLSE